MAELIVALDLPDGRSALALTERLPELRWVKIGPVLYVREGPALVRTFTQRGIAVFLDLKWHDIPNTVSGAVAAARDLGVTMATVHALGGAAMLRAAVEAAGEAVGIVGVTVLTSHDAGTFSETLGRGVPDLGSEAVRLARLAVRAGLRGVVASGHEVDLVRRAVGPDPWIVVPGVRLAGDASGDQIRVVEPGDAVRRGATHLVVGRTITAASDPVAAYTRVREAMWSPVA